MRSIEKAINLDSNRERVQNPYAGLNLTFGGGAEPSRDKLFDLFASDFRFKNFDKI